jgi:hypothetical protein
MIDLPRYRDVSAFHVAPSACAQPTEHVPGVALVSMNNLGPRPTRHPTAEIFDRGRVTRAAPFLKEMQRVPNGLHSNYKLVPPPRPTQTLAPLHG